ncbi:MAG: hypothetical protein FJW21_06755 [Acidimicrobiia bacterium]|nr:hypothetical protein [Acidimicrobiia bacterium]
MPTTVHIPPRLMASASKRAKSLGISRNRLIVQALERELTANQQWPESFLQALRDVDADTAEAVNDMTKAIARRRLSKLPPTL